MASVPQKKYSEAEYLALEEQCAYRSEFLHGEIFAMSGGSAAHNVIVLNIVGLLRDALRGGDCRPYALDLRVRTEKSRLYTYPDVVVACGDPEFDGVTLLNPRVIVEVLSPSTESYDRSTKFSRYREISSLREYILVSQTKPSIESFVPATNQRWQVNDPVVGLDATLESVALNCRLPLTKVYEDVKFAT